MNYRHVFHAGNFADVFKHALLSVLLEHLKTKDKPFFVLDSHAGLGLYDLSDERSLRTGEWRDGIARVLARPGAPAALAPYLAAVRGLNGDEGLRWYPGSPRLIRIFLRAQDRLAAVEMHPEDARLLADEFTGDPAVKIHAMDGYGALKSLLPPPERRGLVLIDPPFEATDEFAHLARGLKEAHRRWATGIYMLWYPIKNRDAVAAFHAEVAALALPRTMAVELRLEAETPNRLVGCGVILVNPPWTFEREAAEILDFLVKVLGRTAASSRRIEWLVPEEDATSRAAPR
jgi:23S rRNA (adenine2030-N6)-methyltransferase